MPAQVLTRGEVARRAGIGIETVRFYERQGLIEPPPRSAAGYRQYPEDTVQRLCFIRRAKELGFSLREIRELLVLQGDPDVTCGDIEERARRKLVDIERRIRDLEKIHQALQELMQGCAGDRESGQCPILRALAGE